MAEQQPKKTFLWEFVNSSFGLFLMSSVVLSLITSVYTNYKYKKQHQLERQKNIRQLDGEISNRIYQLLFYTRLEKKNNATMDIWKLDPVCRADLFDDGSNMLDNALIHRKNNPEDFSVYYNFRYRSFPSLVIELSNLTGKKEHPALRKVINTYEHIVDEASATVSSAPVDTSSVVAYDHACTALHQLDSVARNVLLLPRWRSDMYELGNE